MEDLFAYKSCEEEDYYKILGCDELSSTEQIAAEYKARVLECHPDKHPGDQDAAKRFERTQTAKDVLSDPEKRHHYDKWRHAGLTIPFKKWCNMKDAVHTSMHWASPKKECMLECADDSQETANTSRTSSYSCQITQKDQSSRPDVPWEREPASDILRKFRNYDI